MKTIIVICQLLSTVLSVIELMCSEYKSRTTHVQKTDVFNDPGRTILLGIDIIEFCLTVKYLGTVFHLFACYFIIKFVMKVNMWSSIQKLVSNSAGFISCQLLGVIALCTRLVVLLLYNIKLNTACSEKEPQSFELYHVTLGFAAGFGIISLFLYLFYLFKHMYDRLITIEEQSYNVTIVLPKTHIHVGKV